MVLNLIDSLGSPRIQCELHSFSLKRRFCKLLESKLFHNPRNSTYNTGQIINSDNIPKRSNPKPPRLTAPLFVQIFPSLCSFSSGSGLCISSSSSTSSGNTNNPGVGTQLYFSVTVCVFTLSSSGPPSNGDAKGPYLPPSELVLVRRDDCVE